MPKQTNAITIAISQMNNTITNLEETLGVKTLRVAKRKTWRVGEVLLIVKPNKYEEARIEINPHLQTMNWEKYVSLSSQIQDLTNTRDNLNRLKYQLKSCDVCTWGIQLECDNKQELIQAINKVKSARRKLRVKEENLKAWNREGRSMRIIEWLNKDMQYANMNYFFNALKIGAGSDITKIRIARDYYFKKYNQYLNKLKNAKLQNEKNEFEKLLRAWANEDK